jgi:hypothetical protein
MGNPNEANPPTAPGYGEAAGVAPPPYSEHSGYPAQSGYPPQQGYPPAGYPPQQAQPGYQAQVFFIKKL